ncbi:hypothetical protein [Nocardia sp. NPDC057227]|uniref:hypothetical protein n=1 Tax=Nocardia sp. NPDC057227 TaxID=3346056 RepID=UPI003628CF56
MIESLKLRRRRTEWDTPIKPAPEGQGLQGAQFAEDDCPVYRIAEERADPD